VHRVREQEASVLPARVGKGAGDDEVRVKVKAGRVGPSTGVTVPNPCDIHG